METEVDKPGKTSLDCATIALKVLKTSMRQQVKLREKHSQHQQQQQSSCSKSETFPGCGETTTGGSGSDCSELLVGR